MATTPLFIATGLATPAANVTAISTDRTGAGSYSTFFTGAPSIVEAVLFTAVTNTIETQLLLFYDDGANVKSMGEIHIEPRAVTAINGGWSYLWIPPHRRVNGSPFIVPSGDELQACMLNGSATLHAFVIGGNP